jgi:hypothetical protein
MLSFGGGVAMNSTNIPTLEDLDIRGHWTDYLELFDIRPVYEEHIKLFR